MCVTRIELMATGDFDRATERNAAALQSSSHGTQGAGSTYAFVNPARAMATRQ